MGRRTFTARPLFAAAVMLCATPAFAQSRKKVKLTYTQLLKSDTGLVEYVYPMNTEKFSAKPLENVSVKISLLLITDALFLLLETLPPAPA